MLVRQKNIQVLIGVVMRDWHPILWGFFSWNFKRGEFHLSWDARKHNPEEVMPEMNFERCRGLTWGRG